MQFVSCQLLLAIVFSLGDQESKQMNLISTADHNKKGAYFKKVSILISVVNLLITFFVCVL